MKKYIQLLIIILSMIGISTCSQFSLLDENEFFEATKDNIPKSNNSNLSTLSLENIQFTPEFAYDVFLYTAAVNSDVTSDTIAFELEDKNATVILKKNDTVIDTHITLDVGENTFSIEVTAESGLKSTYSIIINRVLNADADLSALSLTAGGNTRDIELDPVNAAITYDATYDSDITEVTITPELKDAKATYRILKGTEEVSNPVALDIGANDIVVEVTAENGQKRNYTLLITRVQSADADLTGLSLTAGDTTTDIVLDPENMTNTYNTTYDSDITEVTITPELKDAKASYRILKSNEAVTNPVALNIGTNTVIVEVTAENGFIKNYTLVIHRVQSTDADLTGLSLTAGDSTTEIALDPANTTNTYDTTYDSDTTAVNIIPELRDAKASYRILKGTEEVSNPVALNIGTNTVIVEVAAESGLIKNYTLVIHRVQSTDADLAELNVIYNDIYRKILLDPADETNTYDTTYDNEVAQIIIEPVLNDAKASFQIKKFADVITNPVALAVGANNITIEVTAENGTVKQYNLQITRKTSNDAFLENLSVSTGSLSPAFSTDHFYYTVEVSSESESITITPSLAAGSNADYSLYKNNLVTGNTITLDYGLNAVTIIVESESGLVSHNYSVTINRDKKNNSALQALNLSAGLFDTAFDASVYTYDISIANGLNSLYIIPQVADDDASYVLKKGIQIVTNPVSLDAGPHSQEISIEVTAHNGIDQSTYILTFNRENENYIHTDTIGKTYGITGNTQGIYVADNGNILLVNDTINKVGYYNSEWAYINSFGTSGTGEGELWAPEDALIDDNNNIYILDTSNDRVQKFDIYGNYLTSWGSTGTGAGQFNNPRGIDIDAAGNIYVADTDNNRIQKFDENGTFITMWGNTTAGSGNGEFNGPLKLAIDTLGNVYVCDTNNDRIQKFDANGTYITQWGGSGSANGKFWKPVAIVADSQNNIYVGDDSKNNVQKFDTDGTYLSKWGSMGAQDGGIITLLDMAIDGNDVVYVLDNRYGPGRIQSFDTSGTLLSRIDTNAVEERFASPNFIAIDRFDNVFITDGHNDRIQKFTKDGVFVTSFSGGDDVTEDGIDADPFASPMGITVDDEWNVYVFDFPNNDIQVFDNGGLYQRSWTLAGGSEGGEDVYMGLAIDSTGALIICETENNLVYKYANDGTLLDIWGDFSDTTGDGFFWHPCGVAIDADDNMYIADMDNHRIQKLDTNGNFIKKWGILGTGEGMFNQPVGVAVDNDGYVYVTELGNHRVQKFDADGNFITMWGKNGGNGSYGAHDGEFNTPIGIAVDSTGTVYVVDSGNERIQKFIKE